MAVYVCGRCRFCFERRGKADACPDCGHSSVRRAKAAETAEYECNKKESESEENQDNN